MLFIKNIIMLFLFCVKVRGDSNYHTKSDSQSIQKLNFKDEDSLVTIELPEPISIDGIDKIHSNVEEEEVIPKLGMEFETEQNAYDFYNSYARVVRFSIR